MSEVNTECDWGKLYDLADQILLNAEGLAKEAKRHDAALYADLLKALTNIGLQIRGIRRQWGIPHS